MNIKITGTGSVIPSKVEQNNSFSNHLFFDSNGDSIKNSNEVIIEKFKSITGIEQRRYIEDNQTVTDIAIEAANKSIDNAKINRESIDYIIVAHNVGDITFESNQIDTLPCLASKVKAGLEIKNPNCVAYDILFGCPGWVEGVIQANAYIKAGMAKKCLVIGSETLSRVVDPHDRDSMIYSDGAGACVVEQNNSTDRGILSWATQSYTYEEAYFLFYGSSYNPEKPADTNYIKMHGRKIYEFALNNVPIAMKAALEKSKVDVTDIKKILIHQANEKMDEAIISRFYKLYDKEMPEGIMPMSIHKLGNSSVATVPTLYDLILNNQIENHEINAGDIIILASVGAGMNINAIVYKQ
jgi:3-oxoacyl-[acyl-carrier-protein] synthase-3